MKSIVSIFALALMGSAVIANDCRQRVVVHRQIQAVQVHHAAQVQTYVAPVVQHHAALVAQYVALPLVVPNYSVHYGREDNTAGEVAKLRDEIRAIREALKSAPTPKAEPEGPITVQLRQPKAQAQEHDGAKILVQACSKCHDASNAKAKGGGFVATAGGKLTNLDDSQTLAVVRELYSGRMPKGSKLTDADVGAVMEWLDTRK